MDREFLTPPESCSRAISHQECSRSGPPSDYIVARDNAAIITDLNEQIDGANHKIRNVEKMLNSNCDAAEKIVNSLLRKRHHLREALKRSEMRVEDEARKYRQASRTAQRLFDTLCEDRSDLKCEIKCHKEMSEALEESLKVTAEAIQKEAERDREVSSLREELRIANNSASDERKLSRMVSQQVEGLERLIGIQHNEIKQQKSEIADLQLFNKILTEENGRLHADRSSIQEAPIGAQTDHCLSKTSTAVVCKLEEQIMISREQTQKLLSELQQESGQQAKSGNNYSSEWYQTASQTKHEYQRTDHTAEAYQKPTTRVAQTDMNGKRTLDNPNIRYQRVGSVRPRSMDIQIRSLREMQEMHEAVNTQNARREPQMTHFMMNRPRPYQPRGHRVPESTHAILSMQRAESRLRESAMASGRSYAYRPPIARRPPSAGENARAVSVGGSASADYNSNNDNDNNGNLW
ncbi:hypothetical protein F4814DRAFT_85888 [Daldinia grandis]|nr:hypothetical protein F4814DRAFT_85888 [Daldinia grandis]